MNRRSNTGVSILIALTLVLFCFAQTSQAEKGILELEQKIGRNARKFGLLSRVVGESQSVQLHDMQVQIYPSRDTAVASYPTARQNQLR